MMFTDIRNFTTFSEELSPNVLAEALGKYLEVMVDVIHHENGGTIDKFIGDAIMAIWNAPSPMQNHAQAACRAALGCLKASNALSESSSWKGLPLFHTRFGLHKDRVMVGHFGAPNRMNFTAIGDGVISPPVSKVLTSNTTPRSLSVKPSAKTQKNFFNFVFLIGWPSRERVRESRSMNC